MKDKYEDYQSKELSRSDLIDYRYRSLPETFPELYLKSAIDSLSFNNVLRLMDALEPPGPRIASELMKRSGIERSRIYYLLGRLVRDELVSRSKRKQNYAGEPKFFYTLTPEGIDLFKELRERAFSTLFNHSRQLSDNKNMKQRPFLDAGDLLAKICAVLRDHINDEELVSKAAYDLMKLLFSCKHK
jgi:DNA-binding PadR family transcriptional regulator